MDVSVIEETHTFKASEALVWKNGAVARILLSCNLVWTLEDNIISYSAAALLRREARHVPRDLANSCLVLYRGGLYAALRVLRI